MQFESVQVVITKHHFCMKMSLYEVGVKRVNQTEFGQSIPLLMVGIHISQQMFMPAV